jgi:DHA3 family macrolide efflux protein-like MFS transporter
MVEGFRFVWSWTGLAVIIGAAMAINFLMNPAFALLPLLVSKHFEGGAPELSWMEAAMGTGMIIGGIILGVWGGFKRRIITALVGLVVMGALVMAIGFVPSTLLAAAIALNFGTNLVNPIVNGSFGAIIQATVPADRQGRVFSILIALATLAAPVGLLIGGPVADAFGVQTWFIVSGVACALLGGALFLVPSVVNIEGDAQANAPQSGVAVAAGVPDPAPASDAIKN